MDPVVLIWPATTVIICLIFFITFKGAIGGFFNRATAFNLWKFGFTAKPEKQITTVEKTPTKTAEDLIKGLDSNELLREFESGIEKELQALTEKAQVTVLLKHYAATYWAYYFERVYRLIFGSQIRALEHLGVQGTSPRASLRPFYEAAANLHSFIYDFYTYDEWLGFLETHILIRNDGGNISVTIRGIEFLTYLTKNGLSKNRAG